MIKKLLLVICFLSIFNIVNAEVYLLVNTKTNEIKDMSPENDAVVEPDYEKIILSGRISDYPLQYHPSYYKYQGKRFIVNIKKISDEELIKQQGIEKQAVEKLIQDKIKTMAVEELKKEGKLNSNGKIVDGT